MSFQRNFYHFLITQEPEIAYEVRQDYVQTMSKLYFSYFKVGYAENINTAKFLNRSLVLELFHPIVETC